MGEDYSDEDKANDDIEDSKNADANVNADLEEDIHYKVCQGIDTSIEYDEKDYMDSENILDVDTSSNYSMEEGINHFEFTEEPTVAGETKDKIVVYTDGASVNNGKRGARAGVGVYFGTGDPRNISESLAGPRQTNQRAELMAVLQAIEAVASSGTTKTLVICTDSMYTINCVNVWHHKWASCGWVNSQGQQVNNQDLIRAILDRMEEYCGSIQFVHVRGHSGIHGNEQADQLAVRGASITGMH
ncbi:hypothetical protein IW152_004708 [Coemansia sp. BCRC 34962]|nr:hypothetical protein IW152_004708 [Coemansia sp. BCRC 34962]